MSAMRWIVVMIIGIWGGCTKASGQCNQDSDCTDPMYPFCDVNGDYPASNGTKNVCTVKPMNCPVDRCGCTAGDVLGCTGDQLTVCAPDGMSSTTKTCGLGCATDGTRCLTFMPSNGLAQSFVDASNQPDVVLHPGTTIDTDLGRVQDASGNLIAMKTSLVAQPAGAPMIRVFEAGSLSIEGLTIAGTYPVAFVAGGSITVHGLVAARGTGSMGSGPGAQESGGCKGGDVTVMSCGSPNPYACGAGAGGAGAATPGGLGGNAFAMGGARGSAQSLMPPLVGGCRGGSVVYSAGGDWSTGGAGGGAIQLVAADTISLTDSGFIDVGGGGGDISSGGGSGGQIVLETPRVSLSGSSTGLTANGGAGGACGAAGPDGTRTMVAAQGPQCAQAGGDGGTGMVQATSAFECTSACSTTAMWGGGGGAAGRLQMSTADGTIDMMGSPVMSATTVTSQLVPI